MKKIKFKEWRVARWIGLFYVVGAPFVLICVDWCMFVTYLAFAFLWLLVDCEQGKKEHWINFSKEIIEDQRKHSMEMEEDLVRVADEVRCMVVHNEQLQKENDELKGQLTRLRNIYHITETKQ